jgi:hypothetical protein
MQNVHHAYVVYDFRCEQNENVGNITLYAYAAYEEYETSEKNGHIYSSYFYADIINPV